MALSFNEKELIISKSGLMTKTTLDKALSNGIVLFTFSKVDGGGYRRAWGTRMSKLIPASKRPIKPGTASPKVITWFDMIKKEWRSTSKRDGSLMGVQVINIFDEDQKADLFSKEFDFYEIDW